MPDAEQTTDGATREPGWYVIYDAAGAFLSLCWLHDGWWDGGNELPELPAGWTVGSSLADVLRDAKRYQWLCRHEGEQVRDNGRLFITCVPPEEIDAEIARERNG